MTAVAGTTVGGTSYSDIDLVDEATTSKTWVSAAVTVTPPSATNLVGEPHTFTVSVNLLGADGTPTPVPAQGATVTWSFTGPGVLDAGATTCDDVGTTAAGTCEIVFTQHRGGRRHAHHRVGHLHRQR